MARVDEFEWDEWLDLAHKSAYRASRLSRQVGVSRRQLERSMQKLFSRTPQEWLDEQRMALAVPVLQKHRHVKIAASRLGFKQASHFTRCFKLRYGLSPKAFLDANPRQFQGSPPPATAAGVATHST
jgi:AraC-like DNA-binding protein